MPGETKRAHLCPVCGEVVFRIRRELRHRLLALFWPAKRYECHNPACRWNGLVYSDQMRQRRREKVGSYGGTLVLVALVVGLVAVILGLLALLLYRNLFR